MSEGRDQFSRDGETVPHPQSQVGGVSEAQIAAYEQMTSFLSAFISHVSHVTSEGASHDPHMTYRTCLGWTTPPEPNSCWRRLWTLNSEGQRIAPFSTRIRPPPSLRFSSTGRSGRYGNLSCWCLHLWTCWPLIMFWQQL